MDRKQVDHERLLAAYNQNAEHFRALNSLMWQVPLIAMTLTGGLWYGVASSESSLLIQECLLALATIGNLGLAIALHRLRFIMEQYLGWFRTVYPRGFVSASGSTIGTRPTTVRLTFQFVLLAAAGVSALLFAWKFYETRQLRMTATTYYDQHAAELADLYEAVPFEHAHPELAKKLASSPPLRVLDVGAGSGRDASWMASKGHEVWAVEPSSGMLRVAKALHPTLAITWIKDSLPLLTALESQKFDVIIMSAVWMHLPIEERPIAMQRLNGLLNAGGVIYATIRLGPAEPERALFQIKPDEFEATAVERGFSTTLLGHSSDLLKRKGIEWQRFLVLRSGETSQLFQED